MAHHQETGQLFHLVAKGQYHLLQLAIICEVETKKGGEWDQLPNPSIYPLVKEGRRRLCGFINTGVSEKTHSTKFIDGCGQTLRYLLDREEVLKKKTRSKHDSDGRFWEGV